MALLSKDMAAYDRMRDELETDYFGKWVLVHDEELIGIYDNASEAVSTAFQRFGRGPYHIRKVGRGPITLPASIRYRPLYG